MKTKDHGVTATPSITHVEIGFPAGGGAWSIAKDELSKCKARLARRVLDISVPEELPYLLNVLTQSSICERNLRQKAEVEVAEEAVLMQAELFLYF